MHYLKYERHINGAHPIYDAIGAYEHIIICLLRSVWDMLAITLSVYDVMCL